MCWLATCVGGLLIASLSVLGYVVLLDLYLDVLELWHVALALVGFTLTATFGLALCLDSLWAVLPCTRSKRRASVFGPPEVVEVTKLK